MKKIIFFLFMTMPLMVSAQSTLTPQQQLEQAQKQLEEAQKALEQAKANAARAEAEAKARAEAAAKAKAEAEAKAKAEAEAKAKADAEAKAKAAEIQKQIEDLKQQTAKLEEEAAKLNSQKTSATEGLKEDVSESTTTEPSKTEAASREKPDNGTESVSEPVESQSTKTIKTRLESVDDDSEAANGISEYLAKDAVPLVDGRVQWSKVIKVPGKSASELYTITEEYLTHLTSDKLQLAGSQVAVKKPEEHNVAATVHEWLVFRNSALSLDRSEIFYLLNAVCSDGQVEITMSRIRYRYATQGKPEDYTAEGWITDKEAVNKKRTRLYPISGKFRRKTIDRKNEIFETLEEALE